jgi:ATP-dependent RNA helicase RhlE
MLFEELNIITPILRALSDQGYKTPTPIQEQSIGVILEGKDLLGTAQTGTGKTAAFAIPILQKLQDAKPAPRDHRLRALVLSPTRELAIQIKDSFVSYGRHLNLRCTVVYGGVSQVPQTNALRSGVDILVATPGRLLDLMNQKIVSLEDVKYFVLDEADHMLDMGFIHDVNKIIMKLPQDRQTMMFSATMPKEIAQLSASILNNPERVAISPETSTVENTTQLVYFVEKHNKKNLLLHLLKTDNIDTALVFSRTKHGADKIVDDLVKAGINAEAIHGNKSQAARQLALRNFKAKKIKILVATDIAARGIDVVDLSHVINYDLPNIPETYVHRIGRTGRAGQNGIAISFCDDEEIEYLRDIQKLISIKIPVVADQPYAADFNITLPAKKPGYNRFRGAAKSGFSPKAGATAGRTSFGKGAPTAKSGKPPYRGEKSKSYGNFSKKKPFADKKF